MHSGIQYIVKYTLRRQSIPISNSSNFLWSESTFSVNIKDFSVPTSLRPRQLSSHRQSMAQLSFSCPILSIYFCNRRRLYSSSNELVQFLTTCSDEFDLISLFKELSGCNEEFHSQLSRGFEYFIDLLIRKSFDFVEIFSVFHH